MEKTLVLLSGGLDSVANLYLAKKNPKFEVVLALTVNYGQRAFLQELKSSRWFCNWLGIKHQTIDLEFLGALGGSALTDPHSEMPEIDQDQLDDLKTAKTSAKQVWVPNRNGVLINAAAAIAEASGISKIWVGFNIEEAATFSDNTQDFLDAVTKSLTYSTSNKVSVDSLSTQLNKKQIVEKLKEMDNRFPFNKVWSCYRGDETPCMKCESCKRFLRAIEGTI